MRERGFLSAEAFLAEGAGELGLRVGVEDGFGHILKDHGIITFDIHIPLLRNDLWNGDTPHTPQIQKVSSR